MVGVPIITVAAEVRTCSSLEATFTAESFLDQIQTGAEGQRQIDLQTGHIKRDGGPGEHYVIRPKLQVLTNGQHRIDETSMGDPCPFRFARRTGGIDHISETSAVTVVACVAGRTFPGAESHPGQADAGWLQRGLGTRAENFLRVSTKGGAASSNMKDMCSTGAAGSRGT